MRGGDGGGAVGASVEDGGRLAAATVASYQGRVRLVAAISSTYLVFRYKNVCD